MRVLLILVILAPLAPAAGQAQPAIPPVWNVVDDGFESGSLETWRLVSPGDLRLVPGAGRNGSTALGVAAGAHESYIYQVELAQAKEAYLTFWFNPNGVVIPDEGTSWLPGKSICLASLMHGDDWWPPLVALYLQPAAGQGYQAYLAWPVDGQDTLHFDYDGGSFPLADGWQQITIGYRIGEWVAAWHDGQLVRYATGVVHTDPYGDILKLGKTNTSSNSPWGTMLFDSVAFQIPRIDDLWVDGEHGDDGNDGLAPATALASIQAAANLAGPGTTVHVQPGVYRETVWPLMDGSAGEPVLYLAENGPGTAVIRGSEPAANLAWAQLTANTIGLPPGVDPGNVWAADLSAWDLEKAPRFVIALNGEPGSRLPLAREPDWQVPTEWKHHELWWAAEGGSYAATCNPAVDPNPDCDLASRSTTQLTDRSDDAGPPGIEPGNLATLGSLVGATLRAMDARQGHYVYRRTVAGHDVPAGRITVTGACEHDGGSGDPGLGWGTKYYVEGLPSLLDSPGEWWYDAGSGWLYLWPPAPGSPAEQSIEISRRDHGFRLSARSHIVLDGLAIEMLNGSAVYQSNWDEKKSHHNQVLNAALRWANYGLWIEQSVLAGSAPGNVTDGFVLEGSEVAYIDSQAIRLTDWWEDGAAPDSFTHSGVIDTTIRDNELHHLGFRADGDNAVGAVLQFANRLRFEGNHVHDVAHNGVQLTKSVIQSDRTYGFAPEEIRTGDILIKDNVFERACQLGTDCGALKVWGSPPDTHVFRNLLITGNVFRDTFGWAYVSEQRGRWAGGPGSDVQGLGGFGLYVDMASGVHAYRNTAYNNAYTNYMFSGTWRDGPVYYYNNVAANSLYGFLLGSPQFDTHGGSLDTRIVDNLVLNNEGYGLLLNDDDGFHGNLAIDHSLYHLNGWRSLESGGLWQAGAMAIYRGSAANEYYPTLAQIQAGTPWEEHGVAGDPALWVYDPGDHDLHDGSRPDLHPTAASASLIDRGLGDLPPSLAALLNAFGVLDLHWGQALDIGRYEAGFALRVEPGGRGIDPGGTARYALRLYPPDLPFAVVLAAQNPSPELLLDLEPATIAGSASGALVVTSTHTVPLPQPGLWYEIPVQGSGGGFAGTSTAGLIVGGWRAYLPLVCRE